MGVKVIDGTLKIGTPLSAFKENNQIVNIGEIISIEKNNKNVKSAKIDQEVAIKIINEDFKSLMNVFNERPKLQKYLKIIK